MRIPAPNFDYLCLYEFNGATQVRDGLPVMLLIPDGNMQNNRNMQRKTIHNMVLRDQIQADLMRAMKLREMVVVQTLRTLLSALDNAEAVAVHQSTGQMPVAPILGRTYDVPRKVLSAEDIQQILKNEAEGRLSAIAQYEHLGKDEMVQQLRTEVALITPYLDGPISS